MKLDPKLPSLVGNLHNVRPLEEMIFFSLLIDLDAWKSIGNQVGLTLIILWREGGKEREGGGREEGGKEGVVPLFHFPLIEKHFLIVGNLHNVRPLEEMIFFSLLIDLDAWKSIGNQVGLTLIILWREGGKEREGGGREEGGKEGVVPLFHFPLIEKHFLYTSGGRGG